MCLYKIIIVVFILLVSNYVLKLHVTIIVHFFPPPDKQHTHLYVIYSAAKGQHPRHGRVFQWHGSQELMYTRLCVVNHANTGGVLALGRTVERDSGVLLVV